MLAGTARGYLHSVEAAVAKVMSVLSGALTSWQQHRRRVRVLVHRGVFVGVPEPLLFVKIVNLSREREVEVTHVWFVSEPPVHVINPRRPLPARLRLDETYETWVPIVPGLDGDGAERLGRVRLSNGKIIKARLNARVPPLGEVCRSTQLMRG